MQGDEDPFNVRPRKRATQTTPTSPARPPPPPVPDERWSCPSCTFLCAGTSNNCIMCTQPRPRADLQRAQAQQREFEAWQRGEAAAVQDKARLQQSWLDDLDDDEDGDDGGADGADDCQPTAASSSSSASFSSALFDPAGSALPPPTIEAAVPLVAGAGGPSFASASLSVSTSPPLDAEHTIMHQLPPELITVSSGRLPHACRQGEAGRGAAAGDTAHIECALLALQHTRCELCHSALLGVLRKCAAAQRRCF